MIYIVFLFIFSIYCLRSILIIILVPKLLASIFVWHKSLFCSGDSIIYVSILRWITDGCPLQYVKEQTYELCLEAVKKNGFALQYVKEQTYELCLEAVKNNGYTSEYIKDQPYKLFLEAVKNNGCALEFVKN